MANFNYKRRREVDVNDPMDGRSTGVFQAPEKKKTPTGLDTPSLYDMTSGVIEGESQSENVEVVEKIIEVPMPLVTDVTGVAWMGKFGVSRRGLQLRELVDFDEWSAFFDVLRSLNDSLLLIVGDWIVYGEHFQYGVTYQQVSQALGIDYDTIKNAVWVCRSVDLSLRRDNLTISHYKAVAALTYEEKFKWLELASIGTNGKPWSYRRLEAEIRGRRQLLAANGQPQRSDYLGRFTRAVEPFETRILNIAHRADPEERELMAARLEQLAAQIRKESRR